MILSILFITAVFIVICKLYTVYNKKNESINIPFGRKIGNAQIKGTKEFQNDYFSAECNEKYILAVISDGLTDKLDGRYDAELSVNILKENFNKIESYKSIEEYFKYSFGDINEIMNKALGNKTGAVVLAAVIRKNCLEWAAIGNCALYLYEDNEVLKINNTESSSIQFGKLKFRKKYKILLCTDGVYKSLYDKEIAEMMSEKIPVYDKAMKMAEFIKKKELRYQDNATLIIIE